MHDLLFLKKSCRRDGHRREVKSMQISLEALHLRSTARLIVLGQDCEISGHFAQFSVERAHLSMGLDALINLSMTIL